jgi:hypothetical protein
MRSPSAIADQPVATSRSVISASMVAAPFGHDLGPSFVAEDLACGSFGARAQFADHRVDHHRARPFGGVVQRTEEARDPCVIVRQRHGGDDAGQCVDEREVGAETPYLRQAAAQPRQRLVRTAAPDRNERPQVHNQYM